MDNTQIATQLRSIAELLELTKANRFEVIAYQNASRTIKYRQDDVKTMYQTKGIDGLHTIQGIGKTIAGNIAEYIDTGKIDKKEKLLRAISAVQLAMNDIPGVGPKTTTKLYTLLKPKTIPDLIHKLSLQKNKAILDQNSIKEKSIKNILESIQTQKTISNRIPISDALPVAQYIVNELLKNKHARRVNFVGSLRRMKDTIGDIDIIASVDARNSASIISSFVNLPIVTKVIAQGTKKATIISTHGYHIDLEIVPVNEYGSLLQHFTGSKEHNIELRTYAQSIRMSVSEHGIKVNKKSNSKDQNNSSKFKIVKCETEEKVYTTLGLQYIPPELREGLGEVTLAHKNALPRLIEQSDIRGDMQMHTRASDGKTSIDELAKRATQLKYNYIAITDHSIGLGITGGLDEKGLLLQRKEIEKINTHYAKNRSPFTILQGVEVNIRADGRLDLPDSALAQLDCALASIHSSFKQTQAETTKRYIYAIKNPSISIIAHPTGRLLGKRKELDVDWNAIFDACVIHKTALEIDAGIDRLDLPDVLACEARAKGVMLVINTDAHHPDQLENMCFGVAVARRAWLTKHDILNTMDIRNVLAWLGKTEEGY